MPYHEDIHEFSARMGCTPMLIRGRYVFPNGSLSDGSTHIEPPDDAIELAKIQYEYSKAKLDAAIKIYRQNKANIKEQALWHRMGAGPSPEPGWREHLQKLADEIDQLQTQTSLLRGKMTNNEQVHVNYRAEQRQQASEVIAKLSELPVY